MRWVITAFLWYVLGTMAMYMMAYAGDVSWKTWYGVWDKGKDFLLIMAVIHLMVQSRRRWFYPLALFALVRALWAIVAFYRGYAVNDPRVITILFIALSIVSIIFMSVALYKWYIRNR